MLLFSLPLTSAPQPPWPPSPYPSSLRPSPSTPFPTTFISSYLHPLPPRPPVLQATFKVKSLARDTFASSATGSSPRATTCRSTREPTQTSVPSLASSVTRGFAGRTTLGTTVSLTVQLDHSPATAVERVLGQRGPWRSTGWFTHRAAHSAQHPAPPPPPPH